MFLRNAGFGCAAAMLASLAVAGCGSLSYEQSQAYRGAQQELAAAKRDPAVRRHGGVFLRDAEATLAKARGDPAQVEHLAYLAQRKVEIARSITGLQVASANLEALAESSVEKGSVRSQMADRAVSADRKATPGAASKKTAPAVKTAAVAGDPPKPPKKKPVTAPTDASIGYALQDAIARKDPRSAVFTISGAEAAGERPKLTPDAARELQPLVTYMRDNANSRIIVEGFARRGKGGREEDLKRSLGMAEAVRDYLTGEGIDGARIYTLGRGGDAAPGKAADGRIEIGLFRGIGEPTPALTSRTGAAAPADRQPAP